MTKLITLIAAFAATAAAPALAETNVWKTGQSYTIRSADLDQKTPEGRAELLARVEFAGDQALRGPRAAVRYDACVTRSRDAAIAGSPASVRRVIAQALAERDGATQVAAR